MAKKKQSEEEHHEELVQGMEKQLKEILDNSAQPVFVYLDDRHKTCNLKFAKLMGYASTKAFNETDVNFVEAFIDEKSQDKIAENYHGPFSQKLMATVLKLKVKRKNGERVAVEVIHVPMMFEGHLFAVGFVNKL